ncbi:unnamed protein product, partial [Adineta ricciae]
KNVSSARIESSNQKESNSTHLFSTINFNRMIDPFSTVCHRNNHKSIVDLNNNN